MRVHMQNLRALAKVSAPGHIRLRWDWSLGIWVLTFPQLSNGGW
jgi:hypothetical protein